MEDDHFQDECAVVGIVGDSEAAKYCYLSLYSMQHRGQEGAGIVTSDRHCMYAHRDMGLVADVFDANTLSELKGSLAIGHTRYATFGNKDRANLQPLIANFADNSFAVAHNGNLINALDLRGELERQGAIFSTTSDSEVILHLIARATHCDNILEKTAAALERVQGAYSLVVLTLNRLIAVRDPSGVRPLCLGKLGDAYIVSSESCAFDLVGAQFVRDIKPGELVEVRADGSIRSMFLKSEAKPAFCVFEYIYFARPDSVVEGLNVYEARKALGVELAREYPSDADFVVPVPDSGVPAAIGFSRESGIPLEFGLIRNHYVGRTFIEPKQSIRDFGVKIKLNANSSILSGKKVVLVDDSIVRGTTCKKIVKMVKEAGATEVHLRISSPPTTGSCYYGIDTPSETELIAAHKSVDEICRYVKADSLGYLSLEGVRRATKSGKCSYCDACFSGNYPLGKPGSGNDKASERLGVVKSLFRA